MELVQKEKECLKMKRKCQLLTKENANLRQLYQDVICLKAFKTDNNEAQMITSLPCTAVLSHPAVLSLSSHFSF